MFIAQVRCGKGKENTRDLKKASVYLINKILMQKIDSSVLKGT
jgi:hypothetical protein